jgi:uncharacterized membrane protein YccC
MSDNEQKMIKRLRGAGLTLILGLLVEAFSLIWNHPLAFIAFATVGMLLLFAGVVIYLLSLLGYTTTVERGVAAVPEKV